MRRKKVFWPECLTLALRVKTRWGQRIVGRQEPSFNRREGSKWLKVEGKNEQTRGLEGHLVAALELQLVFV